MNQVWQQSSTMIARGFVGLMVMLLLAACERRQEVGADIDSHLMSGYGFLELNQYRAALIEVQNALKIEPDNEQALLLEVNVHLELGTVKRALALISQFKGESFEYAETWVVANLENRKYAIALTYIRSNLGLFAGQELKQNLFLTQAYLGLGLTTEAEPYLQKALEISPQGEEPRILQAAMLIRNGDLAEAETSLKATLGDYPESVSAREWLLTLLLRQDRLEEAEVMLTETLGVLPATDIYTRQRAGVIQTLIALLSRQGRSGEALIYQRMLAEAFPQAQENKARYREALEELEGNNIERAEQILLELYDSDPGNETGATLLGLISFTRGETGLAHQYFSESIDAGSAAPGLVSRMAANMMRMNRPEQVMEVLEARVETTRDPQILVMYAMAAINSRRPAVGIATLERAIGYYPDNARLRMLLAGYYNSLTPPGHEAALEVIEAGYRAASGSREMLVALAEQLFQMGRETQAEELLVRIQKESAEDAEVFVLAATLHQRTGKLDQAEIEFGIALKLEPQLKPALFGLANIYAIRKQWESAREILQRVLQLDGNDELAIRGLFQSYAEEGRLKEGFSAVMELESVDLNRAASVITEYLIDSNELESAETQLQLMVAQVPDSMQTRRLEAQVAYKQALRARTSGDFDKARQQIFRAMSTFPRNRQMLALLALIEIENEQLDEAEKVLEEMKGIFSEGPLLRELYGELAFARGDVVEAESQYRGAWNATPTDSRGIGVHRALVELGDIARIESFTSEWVQMLPQSTLAVIRRVEVVDDDYHRAARLYEASLRTMPDNPLILNNLAWVYLTLDRSSDALQAAKRAFDSAPGNADVLDTYGWMLHQSGNGERAVQILEKASAIAPNNQVILGHLNAVRG